MIAFVASACVMVIELVASRLIAQHVGTNLYTWTAIIAVVLAGIALGNLLGGLAADRPAARTGGLLSAALVLAGAMALGSVLIVEPVFTFVQTALPSLPARVLAGVALAFFGPAVVLGTVSPLAATWAISSNARLGATVGTLYAVGSIGAIVGTLATGFVLISALGSIAIVAAVSALLALTALLARRTLPILLASLFVVVVAGVVAWGAGGTIATPVARDSGEVIYAAETRYQTVSVAWDPLNDVRTVVLDNLVHGFIVPSSPTQLLYPYIALYAAAYEALRTERIRPLTSLHLGGGAYTLPRFIAEVYPDDPIIVSEIDPGVTEASHVAARLPRPPPFELHHDDARQVVRDLRGAGRVVDLVFADAYSDYAIPFHLATVEFYRELDAILPRDGLVLHNVIDDLDRPHMLAAIVATIGAVHPYVAVVSRAPVDALLGRDTFVVLSSRSPIDSDAILRVARAAGMDPSLVPTGDVIDAVAPRHALVLTDDFAPVERLVLQLYGTDAR